MTPKVDLEKAFESESDTVPWVYLFAVDYFYTSFVCVIHVPLL